MAMDPEGGAREGVPRLSPQKRVGAGLTGSAS